MGFIDVLKEKAKSSVKTIVLPETEDMRTLEATEKILKEGIAKVVLVGNEETVKKSAAEGGFDITGAQIVDPATSEKTQGYIDKLVELRQKKGMTPEQAKEILLNQYLYYGVMMVKMGDADGMVSGACHSTADTLRPCL
ncbi:MAG: phosphate acyltransferase, partial [Oscillospiraceae bacterium]